jgi:CBS domain-containing membrane protein
MLSQTRALLKKEFRMKVSDIMSTEVICISDGASLKDAHHLMQTRGVRHLPVISETDGTLVGILTHKKMIASVLSMLNKYGQGALDRKERYTPIATVMDKDCQSLTPDEPLTVVVEYFIGNKLGCLPVVDNNKKVLGIVTSSDFIKLCRTLLQQQA